MRMHVLQTFFYLPCFCFDGTGDGWMDVGSVKSRLWTGGERAGALLSLIVRQGRLLLLLSCCFDRALRSDRLASKKGWEKWNPREFSSQPRKNAQCHSSDPHTNTESSSLSAIKARIPSQPKLHQFLLLQRWPPRAPPRPPPS